MFFSFAFCTFFKIFHVRLGKKSKSVSFSRVYVCVKAKLTLVSFFFTVFSMHLSLIMQSRDANASKDTIRNGGAALHKLLTVLTLPTELWDKMSLYLY